MKNIYIDILLLVIITFVNMILITLNLFIEIYTIKKYLLIAIV
jgi:hypothetical protein